MSSDLQSSISKQQESVLREALDTLQVKFDGELERRYLRHSHRRARDLISQSIYLLVFLYLLVILPVIALVDSPEMTQWRAYGVYPIAIALLALWSTTRLAWLRPHTIGVMYFALGLSLCGTLLGAIALEGHFPGQISAFETIYLLIIGFSILRLPPRQTLITCVGALAVAVIGAIMLGFSLPLLAMLLYFAIPLFICTINGYVLDISARRNFANNLLLESESQQLARWRQQAEKDTLRQQQLNLFMESIAGNLTPPVLLERVLGYLVEQVDARAGAAYILQDDELLQQATWGLNAQARERQHFDRDETLLGAALNQKLALQQHQVPEGYLDLEVGEGRRQPASLLLWPIHQGDHPLGVIEIASTRAFTEDEQALLNELHRPLAFALQSAQRRQHFLDQMEKQKAAQAANQ
ncbi:MAG: GAF domain-containing protein [Pseudomonadales bacterium]|nr:GAF domain-containing protein [Pseudomonadales bacterium]